jgi:hypothetical protein
MAGWMKGAILQSRKANLWFETAPAFRWLTHVRTTSNGQKWSKKRQGVAITLAVALRHGCHRPV